MSREPLDILVIGGGVVGSGCALDAATRGLRVGLVEARDFASGTSSRSSKLVHGGLRYLEMLDFALVAEALKERSLLIQTLAPHLVRPVPFLYPLRHRLWERMYAGAGLALYDSLGLLSGRGRGVPGHRHCSRRSALRLAPSLRADALVGGIRYYDAQVDDARHTMMLARTAAAHGALIASRTRVVDLLRDGDRVVGALVHDLESDRSFEFRAEQVINATGVWTDEVQSLAGDEEQLRVRASKGVHLVVPRDRIQSETGLILRTHTSVLFVIPWGRHWIIGTTDTPWSWGKADPRASGADVDYLLSTINSVLRRPLQRHDVQAVYAGLRPLLAGGSTPTSKLSREHAVWSLLPGLVTIAGGKYTTYRIMAKDAVDAAALGLTDDGSRDVQASRTERVPLLGAEGYHELWSSRPDLARRLGLSEEQVTHLLQRHGSLISEVVALFDADPSLRLSLDGAPTYLRAEVVHAAACEGALHLDDVLSRRLRIAIETFDSGEGCAAEVAQLMGGRLGWSDEQTRRELADYREAVAAALEAQAAPDDESAAEGRTPHLASEAAG
jgi:glycerol-3-phosphate dehydrogenase